MDKEIILQKFYDTVAFDSEKARAYIMKLEYSQDAYLLSQIALTYRDKAMFFKNGRIRKRYIERKLISAKRYIDRAFKLQPNCKNVLYLKGTIYSALGERFTAIDCYAKIIEDGVRLDTDYNCSDSDKSYVEMIINDSHLQLYRLFKSTNIKLANKLLKEYKKHLKKGVQTIYIPIENFL